MDNLQREIELKEIECVFCGYKEAVKVNEEIKDEKTGFFAGGGIDAWECPCCGEEKEFDLECLEKDFKVFIDFTERNDWGGLLNFCQNNKFNDFILISLAKYYLQNKEFKKAEEIARVLLEIDKNDWEAKELIERIERKDNKNRIKVTFDDIEGAFQFCTIVMPHFLDLKKEEIVFWSDYNPMPEDEKLKQSLDDDPDRFIKIPEQDSNEGYQLMESFIHEIGSHQGKREIAGELAEAISRRKPFRNFKDTLLDYPEIREQWFKFENEIIRERVYEWLREHNLVCKVEDEN